MDESAISPRIVKLADDLRPLAALRPSRQASTDRGDAHALRLRLKAPCGEFQEGTFQLQPHERLVRTYDWTICAIIGDTRGNERYRIRVYASTAKGVAMIHEEAPITPRVHAFDNGLLWIRRDAMLRPYQVLWLGEGDKHPSVVLEEPNRNRRLDVRIARDGIAILVSRGAKTSSHWVLRAAPNSVPMCRKLKTDTEDADIVISCGSLAILDRIHGKLSFVDDRTSYPAPSPGFIGQYLQAVGDTLVVVGRNNGRMAIWVPELGPAAVWNAPPAGTMLPSIDTDNSRLVFLVSSPIHRPQAIPASVGEEIHPVSTGRAQTHLLSAESKDGVHIPVTLFLPPGVEPRPVAVHVYGAYGISLEGPYDPFTDDLLSRGIAVAYCHVRGGGEYGPNWHRQAMGRRSQSVEDLLVGVDLLRRYEQIDAKRIALTAASAGGLTAAAACLDEPSWFKALYLVNPFLDPLGALMDPDANLATTDWAEFGNPHIDSGHKSMLEQVSPMKIAGELPPHSSALPSAWIRGARSDSRVDVSTIERFCSLYRRASLSMDSRHVVCRISAGGHIGGAAMDKAHNENLLAHAWLIEELSA